LKGEKPGFLLIHIRLLFLSASGVKALGLRSLGYLSVVCSCLRVLGIQLFYKDKYLGNQVIYQIISDTFKEANTKPVKRKLKIQQS
jgi:hypothetical protein